MTNLCRLSESKNCLLNLTNTLDDLVKDSDTEKDKMKAGQGLLDESRPGAVVKCYQARVIFARKVHQLFFFWQPAGDCRRRAVTMNGEYVHCNLIDI